MHKTTEQKCKTKKFKDEKKVIEGIMENYRVYKFKLTKININPELANFTNKEKLESYIKLIDSVLSCITPESKKVITDVFINGDRIADTPYSAATQYIKVKKAMEEFFLFYY